MKETEIIDIQETAIRAEGPFTQNTSTTKMDKVDVRAATSQPRCSLLGVLKSEWVKLWSLRAVQVTAVFMPVPMTIVNLLALLFTDVSGGTQLLTVDATVRVFTIIDLIFIVVLGGIFAAGESSMGSVRPSLGMIPNRGLLVMARVMVSTLSVLTLSIPAVGINAAPDLIVLPTWGVEQSLESPAVRMIVDLCLCSMLMGLFLFCIGLLGRSNVGTISVTLGILWILPSVVRMLGGGEMAQAIMTRLPGATGSRAFALESASSAGGAWDGLAILAANVVVISVIAAGQFERLDV